MDVAQYIHSLKFLLTIPDINCSGSPNSKCAQLPRNGFEWQMNMRVSSHFLSPTLLLHLLLRATLMLLLLISLMHQSNPTVPIHPAPAHMYLVSPGSGVLANFAWFRVRWGALELLTCTWFPTLIVYNQTWKILEQAQADWQIGSSIKDTKNLQRFLEACFLNLCKHFFIALSRQNLHCVKEGINIRESMFFLY